MNCPECGFQMVESHVESKDRPAPQCRNPHHPEPQACPECGESRGTSFQTLGGSRFKCVNGHAWESPPLPERFGEPFR